MNTNRLLLLVATVAITKVVPPVVVRLAGTNVDEGDRILRDSGLPVIRAADLGEAARKAVEAAVGGAK